MPVTNKALVSSVDKLGRTALHHAARHADVPRLKSLLAKGSDPKATDNEGNTPFDLAVEAQQLEAAAILLHGE